MHRLIAGYGRFRTDVYPLERAHFQSLASSQDPHTLFITCSDSRIDPSMITQTEPGELFHCRVVGNLVPSHGANLGGVGGVASAIEYAVTVLQVDNVVICGHSDCGAMRAFLHPEKLKHLRNVNGWLEHAATAIDITRTLHGHLEGDQFVEALTRENVVSQLIHLRTHPSVATRLRLGNLKLFGWHYQIDQGVVTMYDETSERFYPLDDPIFRAYKK